MGAAGGGRRRYLMLRQALPYAGLGKERKPAALRRLAGPEWLDSDVPGFLAAGSPG